MGYSALPNSHDIRPDAGRLWAGGFATAIVAALIALVGVLVCRWTFGIPILAPQGYGAWGSVNTGWFVLGAAMVALAATGVLHLLMLGTPDAGAFMKWIIALVTLAAVVYPFSTGVRLDDLLVEKIATSVVCLVIGVAIGSLLSATAARAVRRVPQNPLGQGYPPRDYDRRPPYGEPPRGYDDRGGYPDRDYGRGGPGYDRGGYDDRRGYDRGEPPTRQYPPRDRWS